MPIRPPGILPQNLREWTRFLAECFVTADAIGDATLIVPQVYTVATLPDVANKNIISVSDESGGYVLAFSDGVNWRRVTDRAIVS